MALAALLASGFLLIMEIDIGCFILRTVFPALRNRGLVDVQRYGMKHSAENSFWRHPVMQLTPVLNLWAQYTIIELRQTRGFHASEEPHWCSHIAASKLYVLIL